MLLTKEYVIITKEKGMSILSITIAEFNIFVDALTIFIEILIGFSIVIDKNLSKSTRYFSLSLITGSLYCIVDIIFQRINGNIYYIALNYYLSFLEFVLDYLMIFLVSGYLFELTGISKKFKYSLMNIYVIIGIVWVLVFGILLKYGYVFYVDSGYYVRSDYWLYSVLYPLIIMVFDCVVILFNKSESKVRVSFALFCFVPTLGVILSYYTIGFSSISLLIIISTLFFYINIYVDKSKELYANTLELQEGQVQLMISQIQPHFLYNCITSCIALCRIDPSKAAVMMSNFGKYLRVNLDVFKQKKPITFAEELDHIKVYLELETVRFEDKLSVEYEIKCTDFYVPVLSIQPIVENAVKHGISAFQDGGLLKISSFDDENNYYISIVDNGVGFDVDAKPDDSRTHIGIENVKKRLELIVKAEMKIESYPGSGTTVLIKLPKCENTLRGKTEYEYSGSR